MRLRLLGTGTPTPSRVMVWSDYMSKVGLLTNKAASWRDFFSRTPTINPAAKEQD